MDLAVLFTASKSRLIRNHNQNCIYLVTYLGDKDHQGYIYRKFICEDIRIDISIQGCAILHRNTFLLAD